MDNNSVVISLIVKDGNASAVVAQVQRQMENLGRSGEKAGLALHGSVSGMQAASAAIRDLNGDVTHNIRAVERLITTIPGVGDALKAAFPLLGGLAFGAMLFELGKKVYDFRAQALAIPDSIRDGFASLANSGHLTADALRITNDELANQIAKLEHKPQNALKLTLDEAREAADKLASSLQADYKAVTDLLKAQSSGIAARLFLGRGETADTSGNISNFENLFRDAGQKISEAGSHGDTAEVAKQKAALAQLQKNALAYADAEYAKRSSKDLDYEKVVGANQYGGGAQSVRTDYAGANGDQTAALNSLSGFRASVASRIDIGKLEDQHGLLTGNAKGLQNATRLASEVQAAAAKARAEAYRRINEEFAARSSTDEGDKYLFYNDQASKHTGELGAELEKTANLAYKAVQKELAEQLESIGNSGGFSLATGSYISGRKADLSSDLSKDGDRERGIRGASEASLAFTRNLNTLAAAQQAASAAWRQNLIEIAAATGAMSRQDQVLSLARLHTDEYREAQGKLDEAMASVQANHDSGALSTGDYNSALTGLGVQQQALSARYAIEHSLDNVQIDSSTLLGAWKQSLDVFVQDSQDAAKQIGDIFSSTLSSLNGTFATTLTAHYHTARERNRALRDGLSDDVRGAGSKLANYGLQKVEGAALGALGFGGKPDGSPNNPLWVKLAGDLASSVGSTVSTDLHKTGGFLKSAGGWLGRLFGHSSDDSDSSSGDSGGGGSATDAILAGFQGGFAGGGDLVANRPAMVGEMGPELFLPRSSGTIVPNRALGGGDTHIHFGHIDARGANDPAMVEVAVRRGIEKATPTIIAATEARRLDQSRRSPLSRRR